MAKNLATSGIHHITAFAGDAQKNVDFYAGVLGLRLVKKTINFDAPEVYHLYFGNEKGSPGTAMTFFPIPQGTPGRVGAGQVGVTTFVIPVGAMVFWEDRFRRLGINAEYNERFGERYLSFKDYDGLQLELVERAEGPTNHWSFDGIPTDKAIKGFGGALLYSGAPEKTAHVLESVMGLEIVTKKHGMTRFRSSGTLGNVIDLKMSPVDRGITGVGTVHHIAWRAVNDHEQEQWRSQVAQSGFRVTPIIDRQYFKAIYFREFGGILFEIATDPPGFDRDEPLESLGQRLMLPPWLEAHRDQVTKGLPPLVGPRSMT